MAETYTTSVERIRARLAAKGWSPDKALNAAEKQASAKRKRANPGQKGRLGKRNNFKKKTDPVPPKEKKPMRKEEIKQYASNMVNEIHGITGLIGSPPAGTSSSTASSPPPSSAGGPLSTKYNQQSPDDPTKTKTGGKSTKTGFNPSGGLKAKVTRAKAGSLTKEPPKFEDIEEEFGIK
jgi:hypothetical protein